VISSPFIAVTWEMPPKSKRGGAAAARKAPGTRSRMGRAQAAAAEAPVVEAPAAAVEAPVVEAPAAAAEVPAVEAPAEEAPKVAEELKQQPSPLLPQQPVVEEKGSDGAANSVNRGEGIVSAPISCMCCGRGLLL
jgi:hypothetical protein